MSFFRYNQNLPINLFFWADHVRSMHTWSNEQRFTIKSCWTECAHHNTIHASIDTKSSRVLRSHFIYLDITASSSTYSPPLAIVNMILFNDHEPMYFNGTVYIVYTTWASLVNTVKKKLAANYRLFRHKSRTSSLRLRWQHTFENLIT